MMNSEHVVPFEMSVLQCAHSHAQTSAVKKCASVCRILGNSLRLSTFYRTQWSDSLSCAHQLSVFFAIVLPLMLYVSSLHFNEFFLSGPSTSNDFMIIIFQCFARGRERERDCRHKTVN